MAQTVPGRHVRGFDPIPNIVSLVLTGWIFGPLLFSFAECGLRSPSTTLVDCGSERETWQRRSSCQWPSNLFASMILHGHHSLLCILPLFNAQRSPLLCCFLRDSTWLGFFAKRI